MWAFSFLDHLSGSHQAGEGQGSGIGDTVNNECVVNKKTFCLSLRKQGMVVGDLKGKNVLVDM